MRRDVLYKHVNNTDVAFEIIKKFYVVEKHLWKLKVKWWRVNKANRIKYCMDITQRIEIPADKVRDWRVIHDFREGAL